MQLADTGGRFCAFRMDDRSQRLLVEPSNHDGLGFVGWEVDAKDDLAAYGARLEEAGVRVKSGSRSACEKKCVDDLISFTDPEGNQVELFFNPGIAATPFVPGREISGFKTGPLGMGHAVLNVADAAAAMAFYRDLLDFKISDYGLTPIPLYFFHLNRRHHSFALVGSGRAGLHHFMIEYAHLDDVGQGYDIAQTNPGCIAYSLGRHSNDYMTSFYTHSPSGFFVETGWGGRLINVDNWQAHETTDGPSFWGHDRYYLPIDERDKFKAMRLDAARAGKRAPGFDVGSHIYLDQDGELV